MNQKDTYEPLDHLHNDLEYAEHLQNNVIARATGQDFDSRNYKFIREHFLANTTLKELIPDFIRKSRGIQQFWAFIKGKYPTYAERKDFICESFQNLIGYLEEQELHKNGAPLIKLSTVEKAMTLDQELDQLIEEAKKRFAVPADKQIALEKLWDAFERIKTYHGENKKSSAQELVDLISTDFDSDFIANEFTVLTKIGNDYRIRHHETNKIDIKDTKHIEYLFFRMLTLLNLCVANLHEGQEE